MKPSDVLRMYPSVSEVYLTSDGLIHLSREAALNQAWHLADKAITTHKRRAATNNNGKRG